MLVRTNLLGSMYCGSPRQGSVEQRCWLDAGRTVMSAYIIGLIQIHDRDEYKKYQEGFREIFSQYKGEILVVEEEPTLLEEEWPYTRTVVLRFSDENEAKRWYGSGQYQTLAQYRFRAAKAKV